MKIAIDSGPLSGGHAIRGIGTYTRELITAFKKISYLRSKDELNADMSSRDAIGELKKLKTKEINIDAFNFTTNQKLLTDNNYDIIHHTYFHPYFLNLPFLKPSSKIVLTIHDLIPVIYPKNYPAGIKGKIRFFINKLLLKNVDDIIAVSETSKKDICRFLNIIPDKIQVIYEAPRKIFRKLETGNWKLEIAKRYNLPERFVLYVGDLNYNKNIPNLIKACKIVKIPLVICGKQSLDIEEYVPDIRNLEGPRDWIRFLFGKPHPEQAHFKELLEEFKDNRKILRLGFVPDEDLVAIYNLAAVYCQPSLYEGFGLPILEAFACGTPVVAAKTQALVEIGEEGALFADPRNPEDLAENLSILINNQDLRKKLVTRGGKIVKRFSWEKTAKETIKVYKQLMKFSVD